MENKETKLKWHTEQREVDDLIPFEDNPRQITDKQKEDLQKSLEKFDLVEIPAIDTDNKIVAGHQRLKIMQLLGRGDEIIDVRMPNRKLTDKEFREYNLRSNKNTGEWNYNLLADLDEDLLKLVGFEEQELEKHFLDDFDDDAFNFDYKFGTINAWIRIGDFTAEIEEKDYEKLKTKINEAGGIKQFLTNLIEKDGKLN